jgi:two-component system LytT family response regulator
MKMIPLTTAPSYTDTGAISMRAHWAPGKKVALPTLEGFLFKEVDAITLLEAQGNYTDIKFSDGSKVLICKTLRNVEEMLEAYPQFVRIHRSYIINLDRLDRYVRGKGGYVMLIDGQSVSVSNSRKSYFMEALHQYFSCPGE